MSKYAAPVKDSPIITNDPVRDRIILKTILLLAQKKAQDVADELSMHKVNVSQFINRKANNYRLLDYFEKLAKQIGFNINTLQVNNKHIVKT